MDDTIILYTASDVEVLAAKHALEEKGIGSFIFNRKDSAYPGLIGEIELHVDKKDQEAARSILIEAGIIEN